MCLPFLLLLLNRLISGSICFFLSHKNRCQNLRTDSTEMWQQEGESEEVEWSHLQDIPRHRGEPVWSTCLLETPKGRDVCVWELRTNSEPRYFADSSWLEIYTWPSPTTEHTCPEGQRTGEHAGCILFESSSGFLIPGRLQLLLFCCTCMILKCRQAYTGKFSWGDALWKTLSRHCVCWACIFTWNPI